MKEKDKTDQKIAISTRKVRKSFGAMVAVDEVSLEVEAGQLRAVIGPNGAGKTTLFNLICGQLRCSSGQVYFFGRNITDMPLYKRVRLGIGRTFQQTSVFSELTVGENLLLATMSKNIGKDTFGSRGVSPETEVLLEKFGLEDHIRAQVKELSYGDQRKLEILLGLALNSKVLLLDEPSAGLSTVETTEMIRIIETIKGEITIILIEHDMDVVFEVADKITVLHHGRVIADGDKQAVKADPTVQKAYFGTLWKSR